MRKETIPDRAEERLVERYGPLIIPVQWFWLFEIQIRVCPPFYQIDVSVLFAGQLKCRKRTDFPPVRGGSEWNIQRVNSHRNALAGVISEKFE